MCLKVKCRFYAENDIVVYKVLRKQEGGTLTSPFYTFEYRKDLECNSNITAVVESGNIYIQEAFHSFKSIEGAERLLAYLRDSNIDAEYVIGAFVIPKDAAVYEGEYLGAMEFEYSYASEKIIFKGEIEI